MAHFDLLREPWIPCLMLEGGNRQEFSLTDTLLRAPEIRELSDPSPLVTLALHRLLLAVLHRVFGPKDSEEWADLWHHGWDNTRLAAYFAREGVRDRFDLFDNEHPFYQTASLDFKDRKPVSHLAHQLASGGNPATAFDHGTQDCLSPAEAARFLVAFQAYAVSGLQSREHPENRSATAAPLVKGAAILVRGKSLFHTLMLNLHDYGAESVEPFDCSLEDRPSWEQDDETPAEECYPAGYLDLLTWQSRRIRLEPPDSDNEPVWNVVIYKGRSLHRSWHQRGKETMFAFRCSLKAAKGQDPWPAVGFQQDRAVWRDSLALCQMVAGRTERPKTLTWLADLVADGVLPRSLTLPVELFGLCTHARQAAKVMLWRNEHLPLPAAYLEDDELVNTLAGALRTAEEGGAALRRSAWAMAELILDPDSGRHGGGRPKRDNTSALATRLIPQRLYWAMLEVPFRRLIAVLPTDAVCDDGIMTYGSVALREWERAVHRAALDAFESSASSLGLSTASAKAIARAECQLRAALHRLLSSDVSADAQIEETDEEVTLTT